MSALMSKFHSEYQLRPVDPNPAGPDKQPILTSAFVPSSSNSHRFSCYWDDWDP